MSVLDTKSHETALANRVDKATTSTLTISEAAGGMSFKNMTEVMEFAKLLALGSVAVPKHLRGNPGACLAVVLQAIEWRISPISLANKSYSVNDRLSYESSVLQAVVQSRAPIKGRIKPTFAGVGPAMTCTIYAETSGDTPEPLTYTSPKFSDIGVKNSPLWKNDPQQQLFYYSARAWCRRHFPDILLGIYSDDEIVDSAPAQATWGGGDAPATVSEAPPSYDIIDSEGATPGPDPKPEDGPTDQHLAEEAAKRQQGAKSGVIEPMFPSQPRR